MKYPRTDTLVANLAKSHWLGFFSLVDTRHPCRRVSLSDFEKVQRVSAATDARLNLEIWPWMLCWTSTRSIHGAV